MERIKLSRNFINDVDYIFIPLNHEMVNEDGKSKVRLSTDSNNVILIPKGEDIKSGIYLKNKFGIVVELVD